MADVSAAQTTVSKRIKLLGDFSKCRKQELKKELPKHFEEYYGNVSNLELCDSGEATLTLNIKDENGEQANLNYFASTIDRIVTSLLQSSTCVAS